MTRGPVLRDVLRALVVVAPLLTASCGAPHPGASPVVIDTAAPEALRLRDAMLAEVPGAALPAPAQPAGCVG